MGSSEDHFNIISLIKVDSAALAALFISTEMNKAADAADSAVSAASAGKNVLIFHLYEAFDGGPYIL